MTGLGARRPQGPQLTKAISAAMVELYGELYGHARTTATTYINDNVVVCVLENILSARESSQIASVTAFLSANQTAPGVACELFFLGSDVVRDA